MIDEIAAELKGRKAAMEERLVASLTPVVQSAAGVDVYERESSLKELLSLSRGEDAMYDRRTSGLAYALWYQPRRIQDAIRALLPLIVRRRSDAEVHLLDLGAGTGAAWWACAAIEEARRSRGLHPLTYNIVAIEASYPMLLEGRKIWRNLELACPGFTSPVEIDFRPATVAFVPPIDKVEYGRIAYAGYLLDSSDHHRARGVGESLGAMCRRSGADDVVIVSAVNKGGVGNEVITGVRASGDWVLSPQQCAEELWSGRVSGLGGLRTEFARGVDDPNGSWRRPPSWSHSGEPQVSYLRLADTAEISPMVAPGGVEGLVLDSPQEEAAVPTTRRLTAIVGAAGSGKSRVLVERLLRTAKDADLRRTAESILVTAFNKPLVDQLAEWFEASAPTRNLSVDRSGRDREHGDHEFTLAVSKTRVRFINFDKIPHRLIGIAGKTSMSDELAAFRASIERYQTRRPRHLERYPGITAEFLAAEFRRVVYGLGVDGEAHYLTVARQGRMRQVREDERSVIWELLELRRRECGWIHLDTRREAMDRIRSGGVQLEQVFDRVFVDEGQDFLPPDMRILQAVSRPSAPIVLAGDETQALHVGSSYHRQRLVPGGRWKEHVLEGSYRLPIRVCEAIHPVAALVKNERFARRRADREDISCDVVEPAAVRGASLGVRPIVVAGTLEDVSESIREIARKYRPMLEAAVNKMVTAADGDTNLTTLARAAASAWGGQAEVEKATMLRIKGLERPFVLWSTAASLPGDETTAEWIYTVLSRTTGLLVIWLTPDPAAAVRKVVTTLREDRLLFWTRDAKAAFDQLKQPSEDEPF